ncbi:MAG: CpsD/CapB family tyrosine-protein kinase [Erysipelotrichaceae bacterium]|nr:CpsD/CapB family tyrosine-protein kinase [Erysipelotrichaceae bacterium]
MKNLFSLSKKDVKKAPLEDVTTLCENMHFTAKEAYKLLRTNLSFTLVSDKPCKVIGVTSANRGEGKSTTSINMAYTFAQSGKKVLLIDADMRLPSIANKLNLKNKKGLSDYIVGSAPKKDVTLQYKNMENFHIILSGSLPPNPSELLGSEKMVSVVERLNRYYDYIILDLPPVNIVTDALVAKELVDGLVLVVRENYSNKRSLNACIKAIGFLEIPLLGLVLTDSTSNEVYRHKKVGIYPYDKYVGYKGHYKKESEQ